MFKNAVVKQIGSKKDSVTLKFECTGTLEDNYDGFLEDGADALLNLYANYAEGGKPGHTAGAHEFRQAVIKALDRVISAWRE